MSSGSYSLVQIKSSNPIKSNKPQCSIKPGKSQIQLGLTSFKYTPWKFLKEGTGIPIVLHSKLMRIELNIRGLAIGDCRLAADKF